MILLSHDRRYSYAWEYYRLGGTLWVPSAVDEAYWLGRIKPNHPVPARCNQDYYPSDLVQLLWIDRKDYRHFPTNKQFANYMFSLGRKQG